MRGSRSYEIKVFLGFPRFLAVRAHVRPKYLRKFAFDKMMEFEIPESVADFTEGRVPERIGAKHYLALARQSTKYYPRYQAYVKRLKAQAQTLPSFLY